MLGTFFLAAFLLLMAAAPICHHRAEQEKARQKAQGAHLHRMLKELEASGYSIEERVRLVQAERQRLEAEHAAQKNASSLRLAVILVLALAAVLVIGALQGVPPIVLLLFGAGVLLFGLVLAAVVTEIERRSK